MNKLLEHRTKMPTIPTPRYNVIIKGDVNKVAKNIEIPITEKVPQVMNKVSNKSHRSDRNVDGTKKGK